MALRDAGKLANSEQYLAELLEHVPKRNHMHRTLRRGDVPTARIAYVRRRAVETDLTINDVLRRAREHVDPAVCIVEDIDALTIAQLGFEWKVPYDFFANFFANSEGTTVWEAVTSEPVWRSVATSRKGIPWSSSECDSCQRHIEGVLRYIRPNQEQTVARRIFNQDDQYGLQCNTRISYYRIGPSLCLFLVDGPSYSSQRSDPGTEPARLSAWFPCSNNGRGGVPVPQLYAQDVFSLFEILKNFFSHSWQIRLLLAGETNSMMPPDAFVHLLAASNYQGNLRWLDAEVRRLAFKDIREPNISINNRLHDRRYDLNTVQTEVQATIKWIPANVDDYFEKDLSSDIVLRSPRKALEEVMSDSEYLDKFLMDTFQLLMSSINIIDSAAGIEQAKRTTLLTQLAAIYLPLSLVTSIFGMNISGLKGAPAWTCVLALVLMIPLTVAILMAMKSVPLLDPGRQTSAEDRVKGSQRRAKSGGSLLGFRSGWKEYPAHYA